MIFKNLSYINKTPLNGHQPIMKPRKIFECFTRHQYIYGVFPIKLVYILSVSFTQKGWHPLLPRKAPYFYGNIFNSAEWVHIPRPREVNGTSYVTNTLESCLQ